MNITAETRSEPCSEPRSEPYSLVCVLCQLKDFRRTEQKRLGRKYGKVRSKGLALAGYLLFTDYALAFEVIPPCTLPA